MAIADECRMDLAHLLRGNGVEFTEDGVPFRGQSLCIQGGDIPPDVPRSGFDYVAFVHLLEHFDDPSALLFNAWSMVRPGGTLLIVLPDKVLYPGPGDKGNPHHKRKYDADDICAVLTDLNLRYTLISRGLIESARSFWVAVTKTQGFVETPRYAVVIPSHGRWDLTEHCLQSIESAGWDPETILLVDDGSDEPIPSTLYEGTAWREQRVRWARQEPQSGFPAAVNFGVGHISPEDSPPFVVILNNDVVVHEGGDRALLAPLVDPRVAVSGPSMAGLNDKWEYSGEGGDYIEFYCAAVRRSIWDDLDGLDAETFGLGYGEDSDYCIRARRAGYKLVGTGEVCTHNGGETFARVAGKRSLIDRNRRSLIRKHRKGRVIWAVASLGESGGIRVVWNCARAMRDAGWETHMVLTDPAGRGSDRVPAPWREFHTWDLNMAVTAAPPFDIAIGTFWSTWEHVSRIPAARRIGFVQSDEPEWYRDHDQGQWSRAVVNFVIPGFEQIVVAERMLEFTEKYGHNVIGVAQNGVDSLVYTPTWYDERRWPHRVMTVRKGNKVWFDGQEFADAAMNELFKRVRDLEYVVVGGARVPASGVGCGVENVQTYDPKDMAAVYNSVSVYVIPSKIEGSSLTVLEAMACGTPVVCTEIASDAVVDGHNVLVVPYGDHRAIADAVERIFSDGALRSRLYYEGLRTAHERTLERQRKQFMEALGA